MPAFDKCTYRLCGGSPAPDFQRLSAPPDIAAPPRAPTSTRCSALCACHTSRAGWVLSHQIAVSHPRDASLGSPTPAFSSQVWRANVTCGAWLGTPDRDSALWLASLHHAQGLSSAVGMDRPAARKAYKRLVRPIGQPQPADQALQAPTRSLAFDS